MSVARCILPIQADNPADEPSEDKQHYVISNQNRWSRTTLQFEGLESGSWCEFSFQIAYDPEEESRNAPDFAVIGFDFLMEDGSGIDFPFVPGLARTQIDPHSWFFGGPDYHNHHGGTVRSSRISCTFLVPSPARNLAVTVRSWRNSHPFTIRNPKLFQAARSPSLEADRSGQLGRPPAMRAVEALDPRRTWRPLSVEPLWLKYAIVPEHRFLIRGQIIKTSQGSEGALARIIYRDAKGDELPPPYPDAAVLPSIGSFIDLPVHRQARRFTLDLAPPPGAASVEIGFQTWNDQAQMELAFPLEASLDDELLLENISGDDLPGARTFLTQVLERLGLTVSLDPSKRDAAIFAQLVDREALRSPFTFQNRLNAVQWGVRATAGPGELILRNFPAWRLPESPQWTEDPFQSLAWRLEFQSLSWLQDLTGEADAAGLVRAVDLAISWSKANPWGAPKDPISAHPLSLSARTEALLALLSSTVTARDSVAFEKVFALFSEVVRHAFALAQLVSQNVFTHSAIQIHIACALLAAARALPKFPLAAHWSSIALMQIREGFDRFVDQDGGIIEPSLHFRLEIVSLGLILARLLKEVPEAHRLRDDLTARIRKALRGIVAATDPSGSLPPFGDAPHGYHHASWLRRLISIYGTALLSDPDLAAELAYPTGKKTFSSPQAGLLAIRDYERNANWSYFCASLSGHRSEHGHGDCTSFVYAAGGRSWIVDPRGSDLYETGAARHYLVSGRAHNIAIPDGREPTAGTGWIEAHEILEGASLFEIGTNVHGHDYDHRRIVLCLNHLQAIAVFDHFTTGHRPVSFEGFLHFDPTITVALAGSRLGIGYRRHGRLQIIPHVVRGQFGGMTVENGWNERPAGIQGFVAQPTGGLQPANALRYRFSGHGSVCGGVLLATHEQAANAISRLLESDKVKEVLQRLQAPTS